MAGLVEGRVIRLPQVSSFRGAFVPHGVNVSVAKFGQFGNLHVENLTVGERALGNVSLQKLTEVEPHVLGIPDNLLEGVTDHALTEGIAGNL